MTPIYSHLRFNPYFMSVDAFGYNYTRSSVRRKRNMLAKRGLLLTKQVENVSSKGSKL